MATRTLTDTATIAWSEATLGQVKGDIVADSVGNTLIANMAQATIKGRAAGAGTGDPTDLTAAQVSTILDIAPVTKTGNFSLAATEKWVIINQAGSTTVTLPAASAFPGREVTFTTIQAQTLVSNASNVVPRAGGAAGTAILAATDGAWATLVSDGTNWIAMAGTP
jgi:hypothetical protein